MRWIRVLVLALAFVAPSQALAVQPDEVLIDTALEARARALSRELRCMVCQNQSIDDSDAPLARDLRILVRERLKAGESDAQVLDFLVARYGEFVLLKPRLSGHTALLWSMPVGALLVGTIALIVAWRRYRMRAKAAVEAVPLTRSEEARVAGILQRSDG